MHFLDRLLGVTLALFSLLLGPANAQDSWPFGGDRMNKRDLYNLGPLGIKASDAIRGEPESAGTGRRQVSVEPVDSAADVGPEELRVEILFDEGPAMRAGIQKGDVLLGIDGKRFKKGSFEPLAKALKKALSKEGEVTLKLDVRRDGKTQKIPVILEGLGKPLAKPTRPEARDLLAAPALAWLAERQDDDGGFSETLSGKNGAVVQACVAGLAWIGTGSNLNDGPYSDNVQRAWKFVAANVGARSALSAQDGANWNQESWGWVHAGIFLGELHAHSPNEELKADLDKIAAGILRCQESSGGWAHGPGGPNALGYVELNIVSGLALCGLGLAGRAGCELDDDALEKATEYIEASSSGGGVGYSTKEGQVGIGNIGRTAATWLGYRLLDVKGGMTKAMAGYIKRNAGEVLGGHASLMQHIFLAGVAAQAQGGGAAKNFWSSLERDMLLALGPDGSFQPRPWHESLSMASNSDVSFGEVWTTAAWTIVLTCEPRKKGAQGLFAWMND